MDGFCPKPITLALLKRIITDHCAPHINNTSNKPLGSRVDTARVGATLAEYRAGESNDGAARGEEDDVSSFLLGNKDQEDGRNGGVVESKVVSVILRYGIPGSSFDMVWYGMVSYGMTWHGAWVSCEKSKRMMLYVFR